MKLSSFGIVTKKSSTFLVASLLIVASTAVQSASIYTQTAQGDYADNILNGSDWSTFSVEMNAQHSITSGTDFSNLATLQSYDAAWVDQELNNSLSGSEITTLQQYVSSGHRAVLIGENDSWNDWNTSIMSVVGGDFIGQCSSSVGTSSSANSIVNGVSTVQNICGSTLTSIGSPDTLFSNNFAAIYSVGLGEVLVIMDSNWNGVGDLSREQNAVFASNVVDWIGTPVSAVPVPAAVWLFSSGLIGLVGFARRKKA